MKKISQWFRLFWAFLWMRNTQYLNLLNYLSRFGVGFDADINPAFDRYIRKGDNPNDKRYTDSVGAAVKILASMKKTGHIEYIETQSLIDLLIISSAFIASITPAGFEFIDKYNSNRSTRFTNRFVVIGIISTFLVSAATVVVTVANLNISKEILSLAKEDHKGMATIEARLDTLSLRQERQSLTLKNLQTLKTSRKPKHR